MKRWFTGFKHTVKSQEMIKAPQQNCQTEHSLYALGSTTNF
jgi:hypothetical protein